MTTRIGMPKNLIFVRHGQSEGNVVNKRSRKGDHSVFTEEFMATSSAYYRLNEKGVEQAQSAGYWLRDNFAGTFNRLYASEYTRAVETAHYLNLPEAEGLVEWFLDMRLRERDYGTMDALPMNERIRLFQDELKRREINPFLWAPPGGESIANVCERADRLLGTLERECSEKNVLVVAHGEFITAAMVRLERMSQEKFRGIYTSEHPWDHFHNGQILQYTRVHPEDPDGPLSPHFMWRRTICPWNLSLSKSHGAWELIHRPTYTNEDLRRLFESRTRFVQE